MTHLRPNQQVAWQWEDGWTLVRAVDRGERDRLMREFRRVGLPLPAKQAELSEQVRRDMDDVSGDQFELFLFDRYGHRRAVVTVATCRGEPHFCISLREKISKLLPNVVHFVSMVSDLTDSVPGVQLNTSLFVTSELMGALCGRMTLPDSSIFEAVAPYHAPGSCPDLEGETCLLVGLLPRLMSAPTRELEGS